MDKQRTSSRKRFRFVGIALVTIAIGLAGCQKSETSPTATPGPSGTPNAGAKVKVVYIPKNTGNPYFTELIKGFEDAAKTLDCEFTTVAPSTADSTSQISFIKDQIQRKVDVIAISPNSPDALNAVLDEAKAAGIYVITVDADLVGNEAHRDAAVLPTDFTKVGESQIELLGSQIGYEGEIAILSATRDAPNQNAWIAGMNETLKGAKYAKMKLVDTVYGDDEPQKSTTEAEGLLAKHPNLRGVVSPTSVGLAAASQAFEIAGVYPGGPKAKGPGVALTGLSTPNQLKRFVEKGVVTGFQLWSPKDMGALACTLANGLKKGTIKIGTDFEVPGMGKKAFGPNNVVITGPLVTFDKNNIAGFDF